MNRTEPEFDCVWSRCKDAELNISIKIPKRKWTELCMEIEEEVQKDVVDYRKKEADVRE